MTAPVATAKLSTRCRAPVDPNGESARRRGSLIGNLHGSGNQSDSAGLCNCRIVVLQIAVPHAASTSMLGARVVHRDPLDAAQRHHG